MTTSTASKKKHIENQFVKLVGYFPHIDNPRTLNEKIQWLKLYYKDPLLTKVVDKYRVREYVENKIGKEYLVPLLGVYENENKIYFRNLPNQFVLKTNNNSGKNIICKNKALLNIRKSRSKLRQWLKSNSNLYYYSYEWAYKDVKPKIICEKYLTTKGGLKDYQFFCFHGTVDILQVISERETKPKVDFYDLNWNRLPLRRVAPPSKNGIKKPVYFDKMVEIAKKLAQDFPFARVDLYDADGTIYFSELTIYPNSGFGKLKPIEWDYSLGAKIDIKKIMKSRYYAFVESQKVTKLRKIVFFFHTAGLAGAGRSLLELIAELKSENIEPYAIIPNKGPLQKELEKNSIPYDIVNLCWWANQKIRSTNQITNDWFDSLNNLAKYMPKLIHLNPDLIYTNTITSPWGAIAAQYLQKPHIWHIREFGELDHKLKFDSPYKKIIQFIENNSDQIICNSHAIAKHISQYLETKKPSVVYNYVDFDKILADKTIMNPYIHQNSLKILVCGTLHEGKNQLEALKVISQMVQNKQKAEMVLLGSIEDQIYVNQIRKYAIEKKIIKYIHIKDFVPNPYPYFKAADVVLITSCMENYSRTALEGMLLKKPVVTTQQGGMTEMIQNNINGFTYSVGDIDALQNILSKLQDKNLQNDIGEKGFKSLAKINIKSHYGHVIGALIDNCIKEYKPRFSLNTIFPHLILEFMLYQIAKGNIIVKNEELQQIKDSHFFKLWPIYCKIKKLIGR